MHLVAVYGSLKKGFYNHRGLGDDKEFLGGMAVDGVMYSNGSYPKLYKPDSECKCQASDFACDSSFCMNKARVHDIEVYRINARRFESITSMEVGAGYTPEQIETPWGPATIYYMDHKNFYDGDHWVEAYKHDSLSSKFA